MVQLCEAPATNENTANEITSAVFSGALCSVYALTSTCVSILLVEHARGSGEYLRQSTETPRHISKFIITFSCHKVRQQRRPGERRKPSGRRFPACSTGKKLRGQHGHLALAEKRAERNRRSDNIFICTQMMCPSRSAISSPRKKLLHKQRFPFFAACLFKYSFPRRRPCKHRARCAPALRCSAFFYLKLFAAAEPLQPFRAELWKIISRNTGKLVHSFQLHSVQTPTTNYLSQFCAIFCNFFFHSRRHYVTSTNCLALRLRFFPFSYILH